MKESISIDKMGDIFCDIALVPKGLVKNYYLLVTKILGTHNIQKSSIIYKGLRQSILALKPKEMDYIVLKYGLNNGEFETLKSIAYRHDNVSSESVRQVIERAYRNLRSMMINFEVSHRIKYLTLEKEKIEKEINYYTNIVVNEQNMNITLEDFGFSARLYNCLKKNGIESYSQLINLSLYDIVKLRSIGRKSANELWIKLYGKEFPKI